jgi:hypothetical protein
MRNWVALDPVSPARFFLLPVEKHAMKTADAENCGAAANRAAAPPASMDNLAGEVIPHMIATATHGSGMRRQSAPSTLASLREGASAESSRYGSRRPPAALPSTRRIEMQLVLLAKMPAKTVRLVLSSDALIQCTHP